MRIPVFIRAFLGVWAFGIGLSLAGEPSIQKAELASSKASPGSSDTSSVPAPTVEKPPPGSWGKELEWRRKESPFTGPANHATKPSVLVRPGLQSPASFTVGGQRKPGPPQTTSLGAARSPQSASIKSVSGLNPGLIKKEVQKSHPGGSAVWKQSSALPTQGASDRVHTTATLAGSMFSASGHKTAVIDGGSFKRKQ
jgi:hypothetical protein